MRIECVLRIPQRGRWVVGDDGSLVRARPAQQAKSRVQSAYPPNPRAEMRHKIENQSPLILKSTFSSQLRNSRNCLMLPILGS